MKRILFLFSILFTALIINVACSPDEEKFYEGDSTLHFIKSSSSAFVKSDTDYNDVVIEYGVMNQASGTHDVRLVLNQANSTAVQGTDFTILNNGVSQITDGQLKGSFTVRIFRAPATVVPKIATFKIESSTLPTAVYNNTYQLSMSLACTPAYFIGSGTFQNNVFWWYGGPGNFQIANSSTPNQFLIKEFWDNGSDLVVNYNPDTYAVTVPDQFTGYVHPQGNVYAKDATDGTTSTYDPCGRKLTLRINYYIPNVGSFGNQTEEFTGQ